MITAETVEIASVIVLYILLCVLYKKLMFNKMNSHRYCRDIFFDELYQNGTANLMSLFFPIHFPLMIIVGIFS